MKEQQKTEVFVSGCGSAACIVWGDVQEADTPDWSNNACDDFGCRGLKTNLYFADKQGKWIWIDKFA